LFELKGLEEVKSIPCSQLHHYYCLLISVERMDSPFLFLLLAVFSGFNFLLSALISSKRKVKDFFPVPALASNQALFFFCRLNLAIALQSSMLWLFLSQ
jgi:hypothetical protein